MGLDIFETGITATYGNLKVYEIYYLIVQDYAEN